MENEKDRTLKREREIDILEILHVIWKNIVWEILILVLILSVGGYFAYKTEDYYVAQSSVIVKANLNDSEDQRDNDTVLAQKYVVPLCDILKIDTFLSRVTDQLSNDVEYDMDKMGGVNAGSITATYSQDSIIIKIQYTDAYKIAAEKKLIAVIQELEKFTNETDENGNSKYFGATVKVVPINDSTGVVNPKTRTTSDLSRILLITAGVAVATEIIFVLVMMLFGDKITTISKLERVTGRKNFITIERKHYSKKKRRKDRKNREERDFLHFKVDKLSDMLIYLNDGEKNKVYQIQSASSGEGKTTVAVSLAINLGKNDRKVLIIDCDFPRPSVHRAFGLSKVTGITDYFKGKLDFNQITKKTPFENVDIITRGSFISDHTVFFTSTKFKDIISQARKKYDFIILDCAPVKAISDYINISPHVDATLLVVESGRTSAKELAYVVEELQTCKANVVGTVFNFSANTFGKEYYYYKKINKDNINEIMPVGIDEEASKSNS